jgi:rubrerythrin
MPEGNLEEILDFAIAREQEAHEFYMDMAKKAERPGMEGLFTQFAREEMGHKKRLEGIKKGTRSFAPAKKVVDLKIGDYLVEVEPTATVTYQNALILAMKKEKAAFQLYTDLAEQTDDAEVKKIFEGLAQEEAKHKLRFEVEYDDMILTEN